MAYPSNFPFRHQGDLLKHCNVQHYGDVGFYFEFDWILLRLAGGHFEMISINAFLKLNWFLFMQRLCFLVGLRSEAAYGIFWEKYDVSPYDSQRSHPLMNLGGKWDLCVLFVQTAVKCQDCKFV